jgi:hypothetical protein
MKKHILSALVFCFSFGVVGCGVEMCSQGVGGGCIAPAEKKTPGKAQPGDPKTNPTAPQPPTPGQPTVQNPGTVATLPVPGKSYPAGTKFGGSLFGVEYTIPPNWKGGLKQNTRMMLFASDTEPGLIMGLLGFAWTENDILNYSGFQRGFELDLGGGNKLYFQVSTPIARVAPGRISAEYTASDYAYVYSLRMEIKTHPSGGYVAFLGFTTQQMASQLKTQLQAFIDKVVMTPRPTNKEYMARLAGRSFQWSGSRDWYSDVSGVYSKSASSSSWKNNKAYFCGNGYFEVNRSSQTYMSSTSSGGEVLMFNYSSDTREFGEWTIVKNSKYGNLALLVTMSGYQIFPVRVEADGSLLVGKNRLTPNGMAQCP